ncbi:MAG: exonuclease domain-containing protein, partial [Clostridia bacterium]
RNYPSAAGWVGQIDWQIEKNQLSGSNLPAGEEEALLTLVFPSEISLHVMAERNIGARLAQAVSDIFGARIRVEMTVAGDREERLRKLQAERRDAVLVVTREEMEKRAAEEAQKAAAAGGAGEKKAGPRKKTDTEGSAAAAAAKPIIGRSIGDKPVEIRELTGESGLTVIQGEIFKLETKELKGGEMLLVSFAVTDYTSSILCKAFFRYRPRFARKGEAEETPITDEERQAVNDRVARIKVGMNVKVRGECLYDSYAREISVNVRDLVEAEKEEREDTAPEKRVELHMHTNMSTLDALTPAEDLIARAAKWGHPAVAVTDHGVLQSFPAAFKAAKGKIKLIPGCEGYLVDDKAIVAGADERPYDGPIVVLDFESTGLNTAKAKIIEVGAVKLVEGTVVETFEQLVDPGEMLPPKITEITGITDANLQGQPTAAEVLPKLLAFIGDAPIAAHNASFDANLMRSELKRLDLNWNGPVLDTLVYARKLYPKLKSYRLAALCKHLGVSLKNAHRAVHDAAATAQCLARMFDETRERYPEMTTQRQLNATLQGGAIGESWHIILLAKNR